MDISDLRRQAGELVRCIHVADDLPVGCISDERLQSLSNQTTLESLLKSCGPEKNDYDIDAHESMVWIEACLRNPKGIETSSAQSREAALSIQQWTLQKILPSRRFTKASAFDPRPHFLSVTLQATYLADHYLGPQDAFSPTEILRCRLMATAGLRLLHHLHISFPSLRDPLSVDLITCMAAFTDARDVWTEPQACEAANTLLQLCGKAVLSTASHDSLGVIISLLQDRVRPQFAKCKSSVVTPQGRKALNPTRGSVNNSDAETEIKPWKFREIYIVTVFRWVLNYMEPTRTEEYLPLIIPPMLAILDDEATESKIVGCEMLMMLLRVATPSLLLRTGLGEVFEDALVPCLSYLPALTPETESLRLLHSVYPTLIALVHARFPEKRPNFTKIHALDRIMRAGVFRGFAYAGEYVKIAELLVTVSTDLIREMEMMCVKHLKNLIPLLVGILASPFAIAYPPLLQAAALAVEAILLNGWPRMSYYRGDILKGVTICWTTIQEDGQDSAELEVIKSTLQQNVKLLLRIVQNEPAAKEVEGLLFNMSSLQGLLQDM